MNNTFKFGDWFMKLSVLNRIKRTYFVCYKIHDSNTKLLVAFESPTRTTNLVINNELLEHVSQNKYFGTWINDKWDQEIRVYIEMEHLH